ncbi:polysaccharide pyruvyl transferase family protein [Agrococcus terreus]|uniref:polysaccharide pyruvyl transferase family protein n=1 Tax=Agrococcus terreus TaxID=574649 RepID=UPI00384C8927
MDQFPRIGLIDNLSNPDELTLRESYDASVSRYMAALGGNTGNLAFVYGAHKMVGSRMRRVGWGWTREAVRDVADVLLVTCANQIGAHADLGGWADALERFDLPVVLVGLGAQTPNYEDDLAIPEGTLRFLRVVAAHRAGDSPNIGVRGVFTQQVLERLESESLPLGCPSLYISPDVRLGRTIAQRSAATTVERVAVAAGNPYHLGNRAVEAKMRDLTDRYQGAYVVQHPDQIVGLALEQRGDEEKLTLIASLLGFADADECVAWFRRNAYSFHDSQTWMHTLRHYDVVVGARYHGVAFGVQAGVPGMVLHIDNRTRELAATTGIPSVGVGEIAELSHEELVQRALWDDRAGLDFDRNRAVRAGRMVAFLESNGIRPSEQLHSIAGTASELGVAEVAEPAGVAGAEIER